MTDRAVLATAHRQSGFTLVEISVVLVIIALITGSIIGGQKMIEEARYAAWVEQIESIRSAYAAFYNEYNALPGDFAKATTTLTGATTFNGNGDGLILGGVPDVIVDGNERANALQHLVMAGLISGDLTRANQQRPTPIGGLVSHIHHTDHGGGVYRAQLALRDVPVRMARRLDRELDDGDGATGNVVNGDREDWPDTTGGTIPWMEVSL